MRKNKRQRKVQLYLLIVLGLTIGFALLSTTLYINGTANIKSNRWSIHWDDTSISETAGSITPITEANVTDTEKKNINFEVELALPGDFYEFTVDAINDGTIDGKIKNINIEFYTDNGQTKLNSLPSYIKYSFTHDDGTAYTDNEILEHGKSIGYKFRIEYDSEATTTPGSNDPDEIEPVITIYTEQTKIENVKYNLGDLVYFDPVSEDKCDSTTFDVTKINNNESTCYKWRVITIDDTKSKSKIELQLDHNIGGTCAWGSNYSNVGPVASFGGPFNYYTSGWTRVPLLNWTYDTSGTKMNCDYGTLTCVDGRCEDSRNSRVYGTGFRARMITADEITNITNVYAGDNTRSKTWSRISKRTDQEYYSPSNNDYYYFSNKNFLIGTNTSGASETTLSWLLENTYQTNSSGATDNLYGNNVNGYWTLTPLDEYQDSIWRVSYDGWLYYTSSTSSTANGMRPVINVEKAKITK